MKKIAVFFPGIGYYCDKPLLYYSKKLAFEKGYEKAIDVKYTYNGEKMNLKDRENLEKRLQEVYEELFLQAEKCLEQIDWESFDEVVFVSKSIGTIIAVSYAQKYKLKNVRHVLYTPLELTFSFEINNAVAFIGNADAWSDVKNIMQFAKEKEIMLSLYENCNHSLETDDTMKNLEIMMDVMKKTKDFLI